MDFFYRPNPWYAGQFVRKVIPKINISPLTIPFFTAALNKLKPHLLSVLVRNVDKTFINLELTLPTNQKGDIDFDFMERFVTELETERIEKLDEHLSINELSNCELTKEEQIALDGFENIKWDEFKMGNLFERIKTKKLPYKAKDLPNKPTGINIIPCLTSSFNNQGLNYYAPREDSTVLKNVISIPSNSDVYRAYFQPYEFTVLSDAYAIQWIFDNVNLSQNHYLFTVQCINKVTDLPKYSYKNKLGGWNVVKTKFIQLPSKNNRPDYELMENLTSAIKKLVIKDVVLYVERKKKKLNKLTENANA